MTAVSLICKLCGGDKFHGNMQCVACDVEIIHIPRSEWPKSVKEAFDKSSKKVGQ